MKDFDDGSQPDGDDIQNQGGTILMKDEKDDDDEMNEKISDGNDLVDSKSTVKEKTKTTTLQ